MIKKNTTPSIDKILSIFADLMMYSAHRFISNHLITYAYFFLFRRISILFALILPVFIMLLDVITAIASYFAFRNDPDFPQRGNVTLLVERMLFIGVIFLPIALLLLKYLISE